MDFWNESYEILQREELVQLQLERLQSTINRIYKNVAFYKKLFEEKNISPENIQSVEDIQNLPFTTKEHLRENYPYDMFATPLREIVRIHSTKGTTGKPNVVGFTQNDLKHWSEISARILTAAGIDRDDVILLSYDFGNFTNSFGLAAGAEIMGASVIPVLLSDFQKQVMIMKDYKSTALIGTPTYALRMIEAMEQAKINPNSLSLKIGLLGNEPWSESLRKEIEKKLFIEAIDVYGLTEIMSLGVASECKYKSGLHIWEDHFFAEVIDPRTLKPAKDGNEGELVLTTLTKEAFPLIRYRTEDIVSISSEPCKCGRTFRKMSRVKGRTDDLINVQGVKLYPSQIEDVILSVEHIKPHYLIRIDREHTRDLVEIDIEVLEDLFKDEMRNLLRVKSQIEGEIKIKLGLEAKVKLIEPNTLERDSGKSARIIDKRD